MKVVLYLLWLNKREIKLYLKNRKTLVMFMNVLMFSNLNICI